MFRGCYFNVIIRESEKFLTPTLRRYLRERQSVKSQNHSETDSRQVIIPIMIFGKKWDEGKGALEGTTGNKCFLDNEGEISHQH